MRFRDVPNAVRGTDGTEATGIAGKASRRDDPQSEDRPVEDSCPRMDDGEAQTIMGTDDG